MKKQLLYPILFALAFALSGCAGPVGGMFYSNITFPSGDKVELDAQSFTRKGTATCRSFMGLVAWGDCSVQAAMTDGGLSKVHHVDAESFNVYYFWFAYTTNVWGE